MRTELKFIGKLAGLFALVLMISPATASMLDEPKGEVVLTISGQIAKTNGGGSARFDMAMLEAFPKHEFTTSSPWLGKSRFEGVKLSVLLEAVGSTGETIDAVAINDYAVSIPIEDAVKQDALLAYKVDGAYLPVRMKGPLWIVFDYDGNPSVNNEVYFTRSIWQLKSMKID